MIHIPCAWARVLHVLLDACDSYYLHQSKECIEKQYIKLESIFATPHCRPIPGPIAGPIAAPNARVRRWAGVDGFCRARQLYLTLSTDP